MLLDGHSAASIVERLWIFGLAMLYRWRRQERKRSGPMSEQSILPVLRIAIHEFQPLPGVIHHTERGGQYDTNENTNGLIRQFFAKQTDFQRISHRDVARVELLLNLRPRRRLNFRTPS